VRSIQLVLKFSREAMEDLLPSQLMELTVLQLQPRQSLMHPVHPQPMLAVLLIVNPRTSAPMNLVMKTPLTTPMRLMLMMGTLIQYLPIL